MKVCWFKVKNGRKPMAGECGVCETCKYFREDEPGDEKEDEE